MSINNLVATHLAVVTDGTSTPIEECVSLEEAKAHLRVTVSAEDTLISALIIAAREYVEKHTCRAINQTTYVWSIDRFPTTGAMVLPRSPVQSVTSVKYYDSSGTQQTWNSSLYIVEAGDGGRLFPVPGNSYPEIQDRPSCVEVEYVAGYEVIPETIKCAIKLMLGHLYANREAVSDGQMYEVPVALQSLIALNKWGSYGMNGDYHLSVLP